MDQAQGITGKGRTTPKHGKKVENRLYSKYRRGQTKTSERDDGINPDGTIEVVAVCGDVARVYDDKKHGRRLLSTSYLPNHGAAVLFAVEFEQLERERRARRT